MRRAFLFFGITISFNVILCAQSNISDFNLIRNEQDSLLRTIPSQITATGNIVVTIQNINGTSTPLPGSNGKALLYDANYSYLNKFALTNSSGVATFSSITTGVAYNIEAYHSPNNPTTIFGDEFWGGIKITHSGSPTNTTIKRDKPHLNTFKVFNNSSGVDVTGLAITPGTNLRIEIKINNPSTVAGYNIKARLVIDRDKAVSYDFDQTSEAVSIGVNGTATINLYCKPTTAGDYFGVIGTLTNTNGNSYPVTDGGPWGTTKWFGVIPSAPTANSASNNATTSFTANWNSVTGSTGYQLDVSTNNGFTTFVAGYNNLDVKNVLNKSVTGLSGGTIYYYRVRAYNSSGSSGNSNIITASTSGNIVVTVQNLNGTSTPLPAGNGRVLLYDAAYNYLNIQSSTNALGIATLSNIALGNYNIEAYHSPNNPTTIFGDEFWGGVTTLHNSGNTIATIKRDKPYFDDVKVYVDATNTDVTGGSIAAETKLRIEVKLLNPNLATGYNVKSRLVIDRNKVVSYDFDQTSSNTIINAKNGSVNGSVKIIFFYTPTAPGDYFGVIGTLTNTYGNNYPVTDGLAWGSTLLFAVEQPILPPDVQVVPTSLIINQPIPVNVASSYKALTNASQIKPDFKRPHLKGEIVIKLKPEYSVSFNKKVTKVESNIPSLNRLLEKYSVTDITSIYRSGSLPDDLKNTFLIKFNEGLDETIICQDVANDTSAEWVDLNYVYTVNDTPNDPQYSQQWHLAKIDATEAWNLGQGNHSVLIGIIDTGVDWDHPDLAGNIWMNTQEIAGNNIDDDNNGYVDDVRGWDWVTGITDADDGEDANTSDNNPMDFDGHGTHCAGIASAVTNNGVGISSIGYNCSLIPLRAGYKGKDGKGHVVFSFAAAAIQYAIDNGARVISMSFGGGTELLTPVKNAYNHNVIVVHAAGNDNLSNGSAIDGIDQTLTVAATDNNDQKASFTNYGDWIDISAPGVDIFSTYHNDTYGTLNGTSMATPLVAGLTGLVISKNSSLSSFEVINIIKKSTDNIDTQNPNFIGKLGSGRINAFKTLSNVTSENYLTLSNIGSGQLNITSISSNKPWLTTNPSSPLTLDANGSKQVNVSIDWTLVNSSTENGKVTIASNDPDESTIDIQITANKAILTPTIIVSKTSIPDFGDISVGSSSASKSYAVSASNLTDNITITAPLGFKLSKDNTTFFSDPVVLTQSGGTISNTTMYVRFNPTSTGTQTGNIAHTSTNAIKKNVSVNGNGIVTGIQKVNDELPPVFSLAQNYPNPFNPTTMIQFSIAKKGFVSLTVIDVLGKVIATLMKEEVPAGNYSKVWDASSFPTGVYYYRISANDFVSTKKLLLLK